jgi:hypothetical protein
MIFEKRETMNAEGAYRTMQTAEEKRLTKGGSWVAKILK